MMGKCHPFVLEKPSHMEKTHSFQLRQNPEALLNTTGGGWWPARAGYGNAAHDLLLFLKFMAFLAATGNRTVVFLKKITSVPRG